MLLLILLYFILKFLLSLYREGVRESITFWCIIILCIWQIITIVVIYYIILPTTIIFTVHYIRTHLRSLKRYLIFYYLYKRYYFKNV